MSKTIDDKGVYQQLAKYFLDKHFVADDSTFMSTRQIRDWIKDNTKNNIDIPHGTFKIYLKDFPYIINKQRKAYLIKTRDEPVNEDELNEKMKEWKAYYAPKLCKNDILDYRYRMNDVLLYFKKQNIELEQGELELLNDRMRDERFPLTVFSLIMNHFALPLIRHLREF